MFKIFLRTPEEARPSRRQDAYHAHVDGLRAVAVLSVILFHLRVNGINGGFVGVDIFFTISGFVISEMIARTFAAGKFTYSHFYEKRARRIVPGLLVLLLLAMLLATLTLAPKDLVLFGKSLTASLLFGANFFFNNHNGYFDNDVETKPLLHLWSLGVEAQFYLFWPWVMVWLLRRPSYLKRWITLITLSTLSVCLAIAVATAHASFGFYLLPTRIFEFLIGAALVWMPTIYTSREKPYADLLLVLGIAMIVGSVIYYDAHLPFPSYWALLPCLGAALAIHAGHDASFRDILANRVMLYLGKISYELYLFHWIIIVFYRYQMDRPLTPVTDVIIFAITLGLAALTYRFVTKPLRYGFSATLPQRQNILVGMLALCILMMGCSMAMKLSNGWPWRLPQEAKLLMQDPSKFHADNYGGAGLPTDEVVVIGEQGKPPQFILFGDSFAGQYGNAMDAFLKAHHEAAYFYYINGCMMLPNAYAYAPDQVLPSCKFAFYTMQQMINDSSLPVIHAQSWATYKEMLFRPNGKKIKFSDESNDEYYDFIIDSIEKTRAALKGHRYVFVGLSPGIAEQKSLSRCFEIPNYLPNACANSVAAKEEDRPFGQEFNTAAATYAATHPEVNFLNPREAVCHDGLCYAINQKKIFYSDTVHFTKDGAMQMLDRYQDIILSLHPQ